MTNAQIAERVRAVDEWMTPEWIERKTRIRTRRFAAPEEATSDLATAAGVNALAQADLSAGDIDYLIVTTSTPDMPQPPTAHLVQHALHASNAACLDINVVCSGFVYGLAVAHGLVAARPDSHALVIAADLYSRILDFTDRGTAVLFGDGAGAAVVGATAAQCGFVDFELVGRGDAHDLIGVPAGGSRLPASAQTIAGGKHYFTMRGRAVRDFVLETLPPVLKTQAERTGTPLEQIEHFIPHQPNGVLLEELVMRCGLDRAHTHQTLDRYANVGSASVAVTLDEAARSGRLKHGDLVLLAGFGGGMAVGAGLMRWGRAA